MQKTVKGEIIAEDLKYILRDLGKLKLKLREIEEVEERQSNKLLDAIQSVKNALDSLEEEQQEARKLENILESAERKSRAENADITQLKEEVNATITHLEELEDNFQTLENRREIIQETELEDVEEIINICEDLLDVEQNARTLKPIKNAFQSMPKGGVAKENAKEKWHFVLQGTPKNEEVHERLKTIITETENIYQEAKQLRKRIESE